MSGRMSLLDSKEKLRCNVRYLHRGAHVSSAQVHTSSPELARRQHGGIGEPHPIVLSCRRFLPSPPPGPWSRLLAVEAVSAPSAHPAPSLRRPAGFAHVALFAPGVASRSTDVLRFTCAVGPLRAGTSGSSLLLSQGRPNCLAPRNPNMCICSTKE
uniref:Uncharacterized protein n=1 Tax=Rousettus aegyptiacus TaxID=9407 RepID=A0A7J8C2P5_ROUAE|nr:hypothetical protein HJG63_009444 [Rousettus aegyptiacus]